MKKVHLTFDDGPHAINTPLILDTLQKYNIKATFFVLGERVEQGGEIIKQMISEGHRVGNHSYSHRQLTTLSEQQIIKEIKDTEAVISQYIIADRIIRPPYGARNEQVNQVITSLGYHTVMWSVDTEDWKRKPGGWIPYGLEQISRQEKNLVLMHDIHSTTAAGLPRFIEKIKALPAEFVDLETLTGFPPPHSHRDSDAVGRQPAPAGHYHTVVAGDTLSSIARQYYGAAGRWGEIYEANRGRIGNPDVLIPGQRIVIPE